MRPKRPKILQQPVFPQGVPHQNRPAGFARPGQGAVQQTHPAGPRQLRPSRSLRRIRGSPIVTTQPPPRRQGLVAQPVFRVLGRVKQLNAQPNRPRRDNRRLRQCHKQYRVLQFLGGTGREATHAPREIMTLRQIKGFVRVGHPVADAQNMLRTARGPRGTQGPEQHPHCQNPNPPDPHPAAHTVQRSVRPNPSAAALLPTPISADPASSKPETLRRLTIRPAANLPAGSNA